MYFFSANSNNLIVRSVPIEEGLVADFAFEYANILLLMSFKLLAFILLIISVLLIYSFSAGSLSLDFLDVILGDEVGSPEEDIGVYENYICLDCGINLPLPEEWEYHFKSIKHEK